MVKPRHFTTRYNSGRNRSCKTANIT